MAKTAIIYSFNTKKTALVAEKIAKLIPEADKVNAEELSEDQFLKYDNYVLGVPTWFDGELPNYWDEFVPAIEEFDLKGKKVAVFGLGDAVNYPENFVDGIGLMVEILETQGATIIGYTSTKGYTFETSRAVREDKFMGLALDLDNDKKNSEKKIQDWVKQLEKEF